MTRHRKDEDYSNRQLTLNLSLRSFDVGQHAGHVDAVPMKVLQEDVRVTSGQRTGLEVCRTRTGVRVNRRILLRNTILKCVLRKIETEISLSPWGRPLSAPGACWSWEWHGPTHCLDPVYQHHHTSLLLFCTPAPGFLTRCTPEPGHSKAPCKARPVTPYTRLLCFMHAETYLFRGLVEGHRSIDQFESVLHLQHQLLPVVRHLQMKQKKPVYDEWL